MKALAVRTVPGPEERREAYSLLLGAGLMLSLIACVSKIAAASGVPPLVAAAAAPAIAGIALAAGALHRGVRLGGAPGYVRYVAVSGGLSVAAPYALSFTAVEHVGAGFVAATYAFPPILTYAMGVANGSERLEPRRGAAALASFAGALLIVGARAGDGGDWMWSALALAAPISLALGNVYRSAAWPAGVHREALAPGMLLAAAAMLAPFAMLRTPQSVSLAGAAALAAQAGLMTGLYRTFFRLQQTGGPSFLSQIGYLSLLFGLPATAILFDEPLHASDAIGVVLTIAGIGLFSFGAARGKRQ